MSTEVEKEAPPKPGYQTSEFWLTVGVQVIGVLGGFGILNSHDVSVMTVWWGRTVPAAIVFTSLIISAVHYVSSRTSLKSGSKWLVALALLTACQTAHAQIGFINIGGRRANQQQPQQTDPQMLLLMQRHAIALERIAAAAERQPQTVPQQAPQHPLVLVVPGAQQQLPIAGTPQQSLPIAGAPQQVLPVPGQPQQQLPIQGVPQQHIQIYGVPQQQLPIAPPTQAPVAPAPVVPAPVAPQPPAPVQPQQALPVAPRTDSSPVGYQRYARALYRPR